MALCERSHRTASEALKFQTGAASQQVTTHLYKFLSIGWRRCFWWRLSFLFQLTCSVSEQTINKQASRQHKLHLQSVCVLSPCCLELIFIFFCQTEELRIWYLSYNDNKRLHLLLLH